MEIEDRRILPRTGYPRRRAVAACLTCRERKKKCDNLRPACSSCLQIGALCQYTKQDASAFDAASLKILDQLAVIETMIRDIHPSSARGSMLWSTGPTRRVQPTSSSFARHDQSPSHAAHAIVTLDVDANFRVMTDKILQWPMFEKLLITLPRFRYIDYRGSESYTYLNDFLAQKTDLSSQSPLDLPLHYLGSFNIHTEKEDIEPLVNQFFERVNIKNPVVSRQVASQCCRQYYEYGPSFDLETCLVLLMCALGAISMDFDLSDEYQSPGQDNPAHPSSRAVSVPLSSCYFIAAEKRLGSAISNLDTLAIQCLCLAGIYYMYNIKPMQAMRMFHAAGSSLQIIASSSPGSAEAISQIHSSLFWTCYKSEREILAEIPINAPALRAPGPPGSYPPPPELTNGSSEDWKSHEESSWYFFLSELALRRISENVAEMVSKYIDNQIHDSILVEDLIPTVTEFERQVEEFRDNLPPAVKFPDVPQAAGTEWQHFSRGRYYRVLELMHRPFLYHALHEVDCTPIVQELAEKALVNALHYLQHSHAKHRHHGTWLQLRNQLKEASLLLAASRSPGLNMPQGWKSGITKALATYEYWSAEFPACKAYADVLLVLADSSFINTEDYMPINDI